ncbi:MAG: alkaline phosphatase [Alsobacter sp.]
MSSALAVRLRLAGAAFFLGGGACLAADAVYPLDRATILVNAPFDFKVEFDAVYAPAQVSVTIDGEDYRTVLGGEATFVPREADVDASALLLRKARITKPGRHVVEAKAGGRTTSVAWDVYDTAAKPRAKNIIFLLGDGMSVAHRTGARIMSRGMTEGKANGRLAMDDMPFMAFVGTSSTDSVAVDSANSMSAYMTGHKTAINAMGVYADRTRDTLDDPRVETIAEALRRTTRKSIGIVTGSEVEDATPAAVVAHTRRRSDKAEIVGMLFDAKPDVLLGGGSAYFRPKGAPGSKRKDDKDYGKLFEDAGYALVTDKQGLAAARAANQERLLGLFHSGNMDVTLDRQFLHKGSVAKFPNQPGLVEMTQVALERLSRNPDGFFLMVEGNAIDKMSHPLDWERALFETIEFDKAVGLALDFARTHPDTLVVATADHTHGVSLIGTVDDEKPGPEMRDKVGVHVGAGFPNYEDRDGDGYPDRVDVSRRLAMFANNFPDYYETFRPKLDGPFVPAVENEKKQAVANEAYKTVPGAMFREGNLPHGEDAGVHAVDDVVLQASGPGAEQFRGYMEQSDVYRVLADVFALGAAGKAAP